MSSTGMDKATTVLHLFIESGFRLSLWALLTWVDSWVPFMRHIDEDELWYYRYPSMDSIVTKIHIYLLITVFPIFIFFIQIITRSRDKQTIPSVISNIYGLSLAYCLTQMYVVVLKILVGRPRPNFYLRCFPEGYGTDVAACDGEYLGQMDGRKSFPSAHAALAYCCMTYMCAHIWETLDLRRSRFFKGFLITGVAGMMLCATMISVTRTMDYHNNYSDVLAGGLIGMVMALFCQHLYAPRDDRLDNTLRSIMKLHVPELFEEDEAVSDI